MKKIVFLICLFGFVLPAALFAQTRQITGKVKDEKGAGVADVTVAAKGTQIKTKTNASGEFSITVPASLTNVELNITHVNFGAQTVKATGDNITVSLKAQTRQLDDVVVIGYGTQKKRNVTGAVANYNAENLDERPVSRVDQALIGQVAGVQVKQTSGGVGKPFSINIRGTGSVTAGNEPLYVIDGFPVSAEGANSAGNFDNGSPLDNLNPNDIESIQVLKDAAAAAIYGSRASNGVVLITTKRGKIGKNQISFNTYAGITQAAKKLDVLDGDQWIVRAKQFINSAWVASGTGRTADQTNDQRRAILGLAAGTYNVSLMTDDRWDMPGHPGLDYVDWQDKVFHTGNFQNYQLSTSGGTENVRYYVSGNYQDNGGYVQNMSYKTFSARANIEVNLTKKMKFGINISPSYSIKEDPGVEGKDNTLHKIISQAPIQESTNLGADGKYLNRYAWGGSAADETGRFDRLGETKLFRTVATAYFELEILKGLVAKSTFDFDNADNTAKTYVPSTSLASISGTYASYRKQNFVNENTLSYTTKLFNHHNVNVIGGYSYNDYKIDKVSLSSSGNFTNYANTTLNALSTGSTNEQRAVLISYFGRLQYDYDGKYLASASMRTDGSSRFGGAHRWGTFPSASLGWRISQEKFFHAKFVNDFKVRASYGSGGNNSIGNYASLSTLAAFNYNFNSAVASGTGVSGIANPDLHWESSYTYNYGLDVTILNNRITASADYYIKTNKDLLLNVPILATTGSNVYLKNIGQVQNKGLEFEVTSRNLVGKKLQWSTTANIAHNQNKLLKLDGTQQQIEVANSFTEVPSVILKVGQPVYSIYVVKQNGVLTADDIAKGYPMYGTQKVGDPRYVDISGDGKITAADRAIQGHPSPDYTWAITNTFKYKGFDLSIMLQGQNGGSIYSLFGRAMNLTGMGSTQNVIDVDVKTRGNYKTSFGSIVNTDWLYSSDYVSIRTINIGYDLTKVMHNKYFKGARVYATAENFFYWDKYKGGWNPEATNANTSGDSAFPVPGDYGGLPLSKNVVVGINLTF